MAKSRSGVPHSGSVSAAVIRKAYKVGSNPKQPAVRNPSKASGIKRGPAPKSGGRLY